MTEESKPQAEKTEVKPHSSGAEAAASFLDQFEKFRKQTSWIAMVAHVNPATGGITIFRTTSNFPTGLYGDVVAKLNDLLQDEVNANKPKLTNLPEAGLEMPPSIRQYIEDNNLAGNGIPDEAVNPNEDGDGPKDNVDQTEIP